MKKHNTTVSLGTIDRYFYIRFILFFPWWLLQGTKTFTEFKNGCITHKCQPDYNNPVYVGKLSYVKCGHTGCNVTMLYNRDGTVNLKLLQVLKKTSQPNPAPTPVALPNHINRST